MKIDAIRERGHLARNWPAFAGTCLALKQNTGAGLGFPSPLVGEGRRERSEQEATEKNATISCNAVIMVLLLVVLRTTQPSRFALGWATPLSQIVNGIAYHFR